MLAASTLSKAIVGRKVNWIVKTESWLPSTLEYMGWGCRFGREAHSTRRKKALVFTVRALWSHSGLRFRLIMKGWMSHFEVPSKTVCENRSHGSALSGQGSSEVVEKG